MRISSLGFEMQSPVWYNGQIKIKQDNICQRNLVNQRNYEIKAINVWKKDINSDIWPNKEFRSMLENKNGQINPYEENNLIKSSRLRWFGSL